MIETLTMDAPEKLQDVDPAQRLVLVGMEAGYQQTLQEIARLANVDLQDLMAHLPPVDKQEIRHQISEAESREQD